MILEFFLQVILKDICSKSDFHCGSHWPCVAIFFFILHWSIVDEQCCMFKFQVYSKVIQVIGIHVFFFKSHVAIFGLELIKTEIKISVPQSH